MRMLSAFIIKIPGLGYLEFFHNFFMFLQAAENSFRSSITKVDRTEGDSGVIVFTGIQKIPERYSVEADETCISWWFVAMWTVIMSCDSCTNSRRHCI